MNKRKTIEEYDALRLLVTILVVVSHSGYYVLRSDYGGCDYGEYAQQMGIVYKGFMVIADMLYSFHMPLFMGMSGALYRVTTEKRGQGTWRDLLSAKFFRLMVPFLIVSLLYSVPIKYASQYFLESENLVKDIVVGQLLLQGNSHLWYLATLFGIFGVFYWIAPLLSKKPWLVISIMYGANFLGKYIKIHIISYMMTYLLWFSLGYLFEGKRTLWNQKLSLKFEGASGVLFLILYCLDRYTAVGDFWLSHFLLSTLLVLTGSACIYCICLFISGTSLKESGMYRTFLGVTLGIYLYSDPLNYLVLKCGISLLGTEIFTNNACAAVFIMLRFALTLMASLLISLMLKRLKVKNLA